MFVPGALPSSTAIVERPGPVGKLLVVGGDEATFAGVQVLTGLEAESTQVADGAHFPPFPSGAVSLSGIFNESDAALCSQLAQGVEVGGLASQVNRDDGPRALGNGSFNRCGIDIVCLGIYIDENGN